MREKLIDYNRYIPNENGEIFSKSLNKTMTNKNLSITGYVYNTFQTIDGKPIGCYRHRAIWYYFNGEIPKGMQIDHINGDKTDNRLENLRLATPKENMNNSITRKKISEAVKGRPSPMKGRHQSEETKLKQSLKMSGKNHPFYGKKRPKQSVIMKKANRDKFGRFIKR